MAHFLERFSTLEGRTLGELNRNFNKLFQDISSLQQNELNNLLDQITPKNLQEQLFHLQLILKYGTYDALENVLFRANKILNKKISGNLHFIKQIAQKSPKDFCERICSEISYITRIRIINRLPEVITDTNVGEAYFEAIKERYGVHTASKLITACGEDYILKLVNEYDIQLSDRQLIQLSTKHPKCVHVYFNEERNFKKHKQFAQYLALNDIQLFCTLIKFGATPIGRKASLIFLKHHKNAILDDPKFYQVIVKPRFVNCVLTLKESIKFFLKLLPEYIDDFEFTEEYCKFLEAMPLKTRGQILFTAFKQNYDLEYDDNFIDLSVLQIVSSEDRNKFKLDENYLQYMPSDVALPLIKKKINFTSDIGQRIALIVKLLETCKNNRDNDALLYVLKYFCEHHKNDVPQMRQSFLSTLNSFKLQNLTEQHWKYIDEVIKTIEINDDYLWMLPAVIEVRMQFKHLNSLNYTEDLQKFMKLRSWWTPCLPLKATRKCIPIAAEYMKQLSKEEQINSADTFFEMIVRYNSKKKSVPVSIFEYKEFLNIFFIKFGRYSYSPSVKLIMKTTPKNDEEEVIMSKVIENYFEVGSANVNDNINIWFLKNKPEVVIDHSEKYFEHEKFELSPQFYYEASKVPRVAKKFTEIATAILNSEKSIVEERAIALKFLAYVDDFIKFVVNYRPNEDCKIDISNEDVKDELIVHKAVIKAMSTIPLTTSCIPEILLYCKADYLIYATKALCAIMYNIPENQIFAPINVLLEGRPSVRVQALHLMSYLSPAQHLRKTLTELGENQQNRSIGKIIFKRTFVDFSNYPNNDFLNLLVNHISLLDENDDESWKIMLDINKIPSNYQSAYARTIWGYAKTRNLQFEVLPLIKNKFWNKLERDLCETILTSTLFNKKNEFPMADLVYEYLLNGGDLNTIYSIENINECKMYDLLQEITTKIINDSNRTELRHKLITMLLTNVNSIPLKRNNYCLEILIESCKFLLEIDGDVISSLACYLVKKEEIAIQTYGPDIVFYFQDFALNFMKTAIQGIDVNNTRDRRLNTLMLIAAEKIAECGEATHIKLLALHMLPKRRSKEQKFIQKRQEVIDMISSNCDLSVEVNLAYAFYTEDI